MTSPERLADAHRRVRGLRAALQSRGHIIVGFPPSLIAEDLKILGLKTLVDEPLRRHERQSADRHEPSRPNTNTNQRNVSMRYSTLQRVAVSNIALPADGFANFGDFLVAVRKAAKGHSDPRLKAAATALTKTGVGVDGGFAVPSRYQEQIGNIVQAETSLLPLCDLRFTERNTYNQPTDESTPWGGTGITANWVGEGLPIPQSKVALRNVGAKLSKIVAIVPVTEELAEDAPALAQHIESKAPEVIDYEVNETILRGTGVGTPLGILNAPALITVAKEVSQTADTIVAGNISKMFGRLSSHARAVWLVSPDAVPQLPALNAGGANLFAWAPGMPHGMIGTLLGIPVVRHQACSPLGDFGDIILCDLSQYLAAVKTGGVQFQLSTHIWFDQDVVAYKFGLRVLGQPWLSAAIAPRVGTHTLSPFVALAARD